MTAPIIELSEDQQVSSPLIPPVVRPEIGNGTFLDNSTSDPSATQVVTGDLETLEPIQNPPVLAPVLAPVIRGKPAWIQDRNKPAVDAGHGSPTEHLAPVIKRKPTSDDRGHQIPRKVDGSKPMVRTALPQYGDSTASEPVTIDMTDRQPVSESNESSEVSGPVADVRAESAVQELSPIGEIRTGQFRPNRSGRLLRVNPRGVPITEMHIETEAIPNAEIDSTMISSQQPLVENWPDMIPESNASEALGLATHVGLGKSAAPVTPFNSREAPRLLRQPAANTPAAGADPTDLRFPTLQVTQQPTNSAPADQPSVAQPSPSQAAAPTEPIAPGTKTEPPMPDPEVFRPIQQLGVNIAPGQGPLPGNRAASKFAEAGSQVHMTGFSRPEPETHFEWSAPALCHRPLFFEDVNLERHGYHVKYAQPLISAAHFFGRLPALPYLHISQRSRVCTYTLGHYRPGSAAPYVWYYPRPSFDATIVEGAVAVGMALAIP